MDNSNGKKQCIKMRFRSKLIDLLTLFFVAVGFCIVFGSFKEEIGISPFYALLAVPFFWIASLLKKKFPDFPEIHLSAEEADSNKLLELISSGVDINSKDAYGQTAIIHLLITNRKLRLDNKLKYINSLANHGFNFNALLIQKKATASILDFANGFSSEKEIIDLLRAHGAMTAEELNADSGF